MGRGLINCRFRNAPNTSNDHETPEISTETILKIENSHSVHAEYHCAWIRFRSSGALVTAMSGLTSMVLRIASLPLTASAITNQFGWTCRNARSPERTRSCSSASKRGKSNYWEASEVERDFGLDAVPNE